MRGEICLCQTLYPWAQLLRYDSHVRDPVVSKRKHFSHGLRSTAGSTRVFSFPSVLFDLLAQFTMLLTLYFALLTHLLWWCFKDNTVKLVLVGKVYFASWKTVSNTHDISHAWTRSQPWPVGLDFQTDLTLSCPRGWQWYKFLESWLVFPRSVTHRSPSFLSLLILPAQLSQAAC